MSVLTKNENRSDWECTFLFLCNRKPCRPCNEKCRHTCNLDYALHKEEFKSDPNKFVGEKMQYEFDSGRIFIVEVEDDGDRRS